MGKIRINGEGKIKINLSLLLLFYAMIVGIMRNNIIIILAMFFSSIGDFILLINRGCFNEEKKEIFNYGIVMFSISHLIYMFVMNTGNLSNVLIFIAFLLIVILTILTVSNYKSKMVIFSLYGIIILLNFFNSLNFSIFATIGVFCFILGG